MIENYTREQINIAGYKADISLVELRDLLNQKENLKVFVEHFEKIKTKGSIGFCDFLYIVINRTHNPNNFDDYISCRKGLNETDTSKAGTLQRNFGTVVFPQKEKKITVPIITAILNDIYEKCATLGDLFDYISYNHSKTIHDSEHNIDYPIFSEERKKKALYFLCTNATESNTMNSNNQTSEENSIKSKMESFLNTNNQIIFTGAPGTGKTYSVREYIKNHTENEEDYKFVQFHPSYDYSDFVEGLRPVTLENTTTPTFVRIDGVFKAFCRHIAKENLDIVMKVCNIVDHKTALDKLYLYETIKDKKEKTAEEQDLCEKLKSVYDKKYYFVVDEINRADLSKVFGELMFGLEESYRGIANRFDTQYKNLKTYEIQKDGNAKIMKYDIFEDGFFIPQNLVFIGTMNDIDRSVESFDFALRRRFQWVDIKANVIMKSSLKNMWKDKDIQDADEVIEKIISMNNVMTSEEYQKFGLSEAFHIGPAYFKAYDGSNMEIIFEQKIEPILREYTRGRLSKEINDLVNSCKEKLGLSDSAKKPAEIPPAVGDTPATPAEGDADE